MPTLPRYRCHKVVEAFKIGLIHQDPTGRATLTPALEAVRRIVGVFTVDAAYVTKHAPKVGGFFVRYEDGYCSWSPAEAFEAGYTREPALDGLPSWDPGPTKRP